MMESDPNSNSTICLYYKWIDRIINLLSEFYLSNDKLLILIKNNKCDNGYEMRDFYKQIRNDCSFRLSDIESGRVKPLPIDQEPSKQVVVKDKPPKVFISHKQEDRAFADALIDLINFVIGADGDKIFCSSIPGYGIRQSRDIFKDLKNQFDKYEIFMVIIHSPRYYQSAVCLNEMGASWVLGTKFASFMTIDCHYSDLKGVIDNNQICISFNQKDMSEGVLNAHLNDFKNDLISFFHSKAIDENKWENARSRFIKEVSQQSYIQECTIEIDYIQSYYIPYFDKVFELLDIDNFKKWAYDCAINGNTFLRKNIYSNLDNVVGYIKSRPKNKDYSSWDSLLQNLGQLVSDFNIVFSKHAIKFGDEDVYCVDKFYKSIPNNPNYDVDLKAYYEHVYLISDLLFELARLCNLILSKIRSFAPEYKKELGILILEDRIDAPTLVYRESEISDTPYPGLNDFISVRLSREPHFGTNPKIGPDGYEHVSSK